MPLLSDYALRKKLEFVLERVRPGDSVLEIGAGAAALRAPLAERGLKYSSIDLKAPADFVGDVRNWRALGAAESSYDLVLALEVLEHVPCWNEIFDLLKPGGLLFATSPAPEWDWACALLERAGLSQRRTSPHDYLVDFALVPGFQRVELRRFGVLSQWGLFRKPAARGG
jgi:SAM-dependent methyltransferase